MGKYADKIQEIVINSQEHLTAEQIYHQLQQTYPKVVLATVYNNLNKLWADGLIRRIAQDGMPDRYDKIIRHDHLVCRYCKKLLDIDLTDLTQQLQQQVQVPILSYDLKLIYICDECQKKLQSPQKKG